MRVYKTEANNSVSIEDMVEVLADSLSDYLKSSDLKKIIRDWEEVKENDGDGSQEDLELTIPVKVDHQMDFTLGDFSCAVESDFKVEDHFNTCIHLENEGGKLKLELLLPKMEDILDFFGGKTEGTFYPFKEATVSDVNQVKTFAKNCKDVLSSYSKDVQTFLDNLIKVEEAAVGINQILNIGTLY